MVRQVQRLNALAVRNAKAGLLPDGDGLYLQVTKSGSKSWIYRYAWNGKSRDMGLGSVKWTSLAEARELAARYRKLRQLGRDPIADRNSETLKQELETENSPTFDSCRDKFIEARSVAWRNGKHHQQWISTLKTYCSPIFGNLPVQDVNVAHVLKALEPIWVAKSETANRVRGRIEAVLDWARTLNYRQGDNPARWRGHLENLLPPRKKFRRVRHHSALSYHDLPEFIADLRKRQGDAARALEFTILCGARTGEVLGAAWEEISLAQAIWTIPAERMKAGVEHRVPLSQSTLDLLRKLSSFENAQRLVFSAAHGRPLSNMALLMTLRRMGREDITTHGFRATFKTWASDCTDYSSSIVESALAHTNGNKVEAAYQRSDHLEKRRRLMTEWGAACEPRPTLGNVISIIR